MSVVKETSPHHGVIRFETNRSFSGMGHERYVSDDEILGDRPPDRIAKALFATDQVEGVHVYAQTVTVTLKSGHDGGGLTEIIENLYVYYRPGVEVPTAESFA